MKLYYVANARMPTEKAHGIQIAKMCEAFIEDGVEVELWVPARATTSESVQDFYYLRTKVTLRRFWVPDFYLYGAIGYRIASYFFMAGYTAALWRKKLKGEQFVLYTVDMDSFSSSALPFTGAPVFSEMHGVKRSTFLMRKLFNGAQGIITINNIIADELKKTFARSRAVYLIEPNGVDAKDFFPMDKTQARDALDLPHEVKIVLYAGRFLDWKGLEILPKAAALAPTAQWYVVGGDQKQFTEFVKGAIPPNMHFVDSRPHAEIPKWLAAADALVVLGTKRDTASYLYTSPMKLFEYLHSGRPIVAGNTPAIGSVVSESEVFLYEPDDAEDLAKKVAIALEQGVEAAQHAAHALQKGVQYSWSGRAGRIRQFIAENATIR